MAAPQVHSAGTEVARTRVGRPIRFEFRGSPISSSGLGETRNTGPVRLPDVATDVRVANQGQLGQPTLRHVRDLALDGEIGKPATLWCGSAGTGKHHG